MKKNLYIILILIFIFMALPVWGALQKALDDNQTILQAIAELITAHEADEEAHLGEGESLQSHRAEEIIDHLAASIIADKYADQSIGTDKFVYDHLQIETIFESLDAMQEFTSGSGSVSNYIANLRLATGATDESVADLHSEAWTEGLGVNYLKNPRFMVVAKLTAVTDQTVYYFAGAYDLQGFGFKIVDGTLYALHTKDSTEYTTDISSGITLTGFHRFKAIYTSGEKIEFYVDDVLKATHEANLPEDSADAADELYYFRLRIVNSAAANKEAIVQYLVLNQET